MWGPHGACGLHPTLAMDEIADLQEALASYAREYPEQEAFVDALLGAIERIATLFAGEVQAMLLQQARQTFERQVAISRETRRTRAALARLKESQRELIDTLSQLIAVRPPDATLH